VDVARAETRVAAENVLFIRARVAAREAALRLKRVVGLPLAGDVALTEPFRSSPGSLASQEESLVRANGHRVELRLVEERLRFDQLALQGARAQEWPSLTGLADYGYSGNLPNSEAARTGSIGARLDLPIFYGGQLHGQIEVAQGRERESEARARDTRLQVEEDVRLALETLSTEAEEVEAADEAVRLAGRELQMARDRYAAGAGDNIQVTSAQAAVAQSQQDQVEALARYNAARVNFAMSLGETQKFQLSAGNTQKENP
jgi:outer membrane protein